MTARPPSEGLASAQVIVPSGSRPGPPRPRVLETISSDVTGDSQRPFVVRPIGGPGAHTVAAARGARAAGPCRRAGGGPLEAPVISHSPIGVSLGAICEGKAGERDLGCACVELHAAVGGEKPRGSSHTDWIQVCILTRARARRRVQGEAPSHSVPTGGGVPVAGTVNATFQQPDETPRNIHLALLHSRWTGVRGGRSWPAPRCAKQGTDTTPAARRHRPSRRLLLPAGCNASRALLL